MNYITKGLTYMTCVHKQPLSLIKIMLINKFITRVRFQLFMKYHIFEEKCKKKSASCKKKSGALLVELTHNRWLFARS